MNPLGVNALIDILERNVPRTMIAILIVTPWHLKTPSPFVV
jgi:hypothetical protein